MRSGAVALGYLRIEGGETVLRIRTGGVPWFSLVLCPVAEPLGESEEARWYSSSVQTPCCGPHPALHLSRT